MEMIKLPYVGEKLLVRDTLKNVVVKEVIYKDTESDRTIDIRTSKGMFKLHEVMEDK